MLNLNVTADVIEIEEFPAMAQLYRVMGVPKTVINDATDFIGSVPDELFVNAIMQALGQPEVTFADEEDEDPA